MIQAQTSQKTLQRESHDGHKVSVRDCEPSPQKSKVGKIGSNGASELQSE